MAIGVPESCCRPGTDPDDDTFAFSSSFRTNFLNGPRRDLAAVLTLDIS